MERSGIDKLFDDSIATIYDRYLAPLLFEPYAGDLAERVASIFPRRVLELAAGTGVATRALARVLPEQVSIVATDLNQPMIDRAIAAGTKRPVQWRRADATQIPVQDGTIDAVICQFGFMFFPDKAKAFAEAHRVLRPGGALIFSLWDRLEENELADTVTEALASLFPEDPPRFLPRTPYGYHELSRIENDLASGGFTADPEILTVAARSRARSARDAAIAFCQGTPLRTEIEAHGASALGAGTDAAADAIGQRLGDGVVDAKMQAHVVTVVRAGRFVSVPDRL